MRDQEIREALDQHWTASNSGDFAKEHEIYDEDAVLDYPQSRERLLGRHDIQTARTIQPNKKRFAVHRIVGSGDLWLTELVMTYDGQAFYVVSIMEFRGVHVAHETQYFAAPFEAAEARRQWVVSMDNSKDQGRSTGTFAPPAQPDARQPGAL
jgi:ketosteroid isomerase-like protein